MRKATVVGMTYKSVVEWIALNDEPLDLDHKSIAQYISVQLAADIYGVTATSLARDIKAYRIEHEVGK